MNDLKVNLKYPILLSRGCIFKNAPSIAERLNVLAFEGWNNQMLSRGLVRV